MADANTDLSTALANPGKPAPVVPGLPGSNEPLIPSGPSHHKPLDGMPDVKDTTKEGRQQVAPQESQQKPQEQERTTVPVEALREERRKRQELDEHVRNLSGANTALEKQLTELRGQLNGLTAAIQSGQVQQQQAAQQSLDDVEFPDPLTEPDEFSRFLLSSVVEASNQLIEQRLMEMGQFIFQQRMEWSNQQAVEKHGQEMVAKATKAIVDAGHGDWARAQFDPTDAAVRWYRRQQGAEHFQTNGEFDTRAYNERMLKDLFNLPEFWAQAVNQPVVRNALAQSLQRQNGQQQAPQQAPSNIPNSLAQTSNAGHVSSAPIGDANEALRHSLAGAMSSSRH